MASFATQMGPTPPGSPTGNTARAFRANKASIMQFIQQQVTAGIAAAQPTLPPLITQAPLIQPVAPIAPRVGGVEQVGGYYTCWTGGSLDSNGNNTQVQPASSAAYRSSDLSQVLKIEKVCTAGLPETRRLPVPGPMDAKDATSAVTIVTWLREISQAVVDRGLDAVFRATVGGNEVYLLDQWGSATKANVDAHVAWLRTHGDAFDKQNLQLSAKFLKNSLDDELLRRVEQELGNSSTTSPTGPDVFAAVISLHTVINHSTQRLYISQLQKLKLTKEPGEDVNLFSDKVLSIARHIGGLSATPIPDLHTLIYQCYEGSTTPTFASTVTNLLADCFKSIPTAENWENNVAYLKQLYRDLVTRSSWIALKHMKEKPDGTAANKASVKSLKAEIKRLKKTGSGTTHKTEPICFHCGESGHVKPNCPNKDKPKTYHGESNSSGTFNGSSAKSGTPKDGEPHTKNISGESHKWCGTCKRWNKGAKAHLTAEHVKRTPSTPATSNVAATTASVVGAAAIVSEGPGPTLTFVAGYLGCITTNDTDSTNVDAHDLNLVHDLQTLEEAEKERERWLVIEESSKHCLACSEKVDDIDEHERTVTHFHNMLLADMTIWFSEKAKAEEAEQGWTLVKTTKYQHKKNKKNGDLKGLTGQL